MKTRITVALCAFAVGCQSVSTPLSLAPLRNEGEIYLYVKSSAATGGVSFSSGAVTANRDDGTQAPLEAVAGGAFDGGSRDQQLLAFGRVAPGDYVSVSIAVSQAALVSAGTRHALSTPEGFVIVAMPFAIRAGSAVVLSLTLDVPRSIAGGMAFSPQFSARALGPEEASTALPAYCSNRAGASITAFDRRTGDVLAVLPTGADPGGLAAESIVRRTFVALAEDDEIQVLDLTSGLETARVPLQSGDRPRELALLRDGRLLLAVNEGSNSVSFVDTNTLAEVSRVEVGEQPWSIRLDRSGRRAFVLTARGSTLVTLDIASRAVVASVPTGPEPLQMDLNRTGDRLYVIERGSPYVSIFSSSTLALIDRIFVGGGAQAILVDPFTDYVYVARDAPVIQVHDPLSLLELARIDVPGPVSSMAIDHINKNLLAIVPSLRSIAVISTVTRTTQRQITVGVDPFRIAFPGEAP